MLISEDWFHLLLEIPLLLNSFWDHEFSLNQEFEVI